MSKSINKKIDINYKRLDKTISHPRFWAIDYYKRDHLVELSDRINNSIRNCGLNIQEIVVYQKDNKTIISNQIKNTIDRINNINVGILDLTILGKKSECTINIHDEKLMGLFVKCLENYKGEIYPYYNIRVKLDKVCKMHSFDKFDNLFKKYSQVIDEIENNIYLLEDVTDPKTNSFDFVKESFEKMKKNLKHYFYQSLNDNDISSKNRCVF